MKINFRSIILAVLIFVIGAGAGIILYPIIWVDEIPIILDEESSGLISVLAYERTLLYTIIEQQDLMIGAYKLMIEGYDKALNALISRGR